MRLFYNEMKIFLAAIITLIGLQLFSQEVNENYVVTGIVYDANTHTALQFISLTLQDIETNEIIGDISSKNGEFELNVPKGKYNFIAESLSFKPFKIDLLNIQQDLELGIIELSQKIEELNEIEVIVKDKLVDYKYDKKIYYASKDIANVGGNAITVLENTPSVRIDEQGEITVRGNNVLVLVDGKPYGGQNSSADLLSLIPANSISRIEVNTHSAKYDAQGGDILNIILKKRKNDGYNGTVEMHGGLPDNDGLSTFLNFKTEKINIFSTASFNHLVQKKDTDINQIFLDKNEIATSSFAEQRFDNQQKNNLLLSLGSEFYINEKNTIVTSILFSDSNLNYDSELLLDDYKPLDVLENSSIRQVDDNTDGGNLETYIDYTTKFKKENHQLSMLLKYDKNYADNETFIDQRQLFPVTSIGKQKSLQKQDLNAYYFNVDYKLPFKDNGIVEIGQQTTYRTYSNNFLIGEFNFTSQVYDPFQSLTNEVNYHENIYAYYANYNKQFKKLSMSIGLRAEFSNTNIENYNTTESYDNDFNNYFPSLILGYTFNNNSTISAQYTPYIDRPSISQLNPFNSFTDERYQRIGNPFLKPSYSNYYIVEYHKDFEQFYLNTSIYYINSKDIILNILEKSDNQTIDGYPIYNQLPINNGTMDYIGFEFDMTYNPSKKIRLNTFIGPYYRELSNSRENLYDFSDMVFYGTFNAMYRLDNTLRFQANYFFQTAKKTALNELDKIQSLNVALSKDLFDGKSTLTFRVTDVFHTREAAYKSLEANTISTRNVIYDTQYLLSFSYRFNKASKRNTNNRTKDTDLNVFEIEEKMQ